MRSQPGRQERPSSATRRAGPPTKLAASAGLLYERKVRKGIAIGVTFLLLVSACGAHPRGAAVARSGDAGAEDDAGAPEDGGAAATDEDAGDGGEETAGSGPCPDDMVLIEAGPLRYCIDRFEGSLVEAGADGRETPFANYLPVDGHDVRAVSVPHVFPQGYISEVQAQDACAASSKYLCTPDEWKTACMGPDRTAFPYGAARRPGVCHDTGRSAVVAVFGAAAVAASTPYAPPAAPSKSTKGKPAATTKGRAAQTTKTRATAKNASKKATGKPASPQKRTTRGGPAKKSTRPANVDPGVWAKLNDPRLGQYEGGLARTGEHEECVNAYGVFDMVGNLHEWVATDPNAIHGTFAGGYYLDTTINGDGCNYRTVAHAHDYHDYSTGFRCCAAPSN